jgi:hypothetical protein
VKDYSLALPALASQMRYTSRRMRTKEPIMTARHAYASILTLACALAAPATAAIRCEGSFQINSQGKFQSLYCEEDNLANVARSRGINVTADQIRRSFSLEGEVCSRLSPDFTVADICNQFTGHGGRCRFFPC